LTAPQETRAITPEEIKVVAKELVCLCGSCNRESLATCTCTEFAVPQREIIGAALEAGKTKDEIVADFVSRYGQMVLASPPPEGYKLLAWIAPIVTLVLGIALVRTVLLKWRREPPPPVSATAGPQGYSQRLQQELKDFDAE
jgi:cytochrome c-type biogenesis protein CcmH/NrfF